LPPTTVEPVVDTLPAPAPPPVVEELPVTGVNPVRAIAFAAFLAGIGLVLWAAAERWLRNA